MFDFEKERRIIHKKKKKTKKKTKKQGEKNKWWIQSSRPRRFFVTDPFHASHF